MGDENLGQDPTKVVSSRRALKEASHCNFRRDAFKIRIVNEEQHV